MIATGAPGLPTEGNGGHPGLILLSPGELALRTIGRDHRRLATVLARAEAIAVRPDLGHPEPVPRPTAKHALSDVSFMAESGLARG